MDIAWIGLGNMGGPMAANLVAAGHRVTGFDLGEAALAAAASSGVTVAGSATEAVGGAEVVFTMLPSGRHVLDVLEAGGVLAASEPDTLFVDSSTIDIADATALHALVNGTGRAFVDAPVSGGVGGAAAGTLTFMLGGDEAVVERVRTLIEPMAGRVFHAGGPGAGQSAKIVNNLMLGVNLAGLCEAATLAERLGLDPKTFYDIAAVSSGQSWALDTWYPKPGVVESAAVNREFEGGFGTDLFVKDLGLAVAAGQRSGTELVHAAAVLSALQAVSAAGYGKQDCTILVKHIDGTLEEKTP